MADDGDYGRKLNGRKKRKPGKKDKYSPELCEQAFDLSLLKATDQALADVFSVSIHTVRKWKTRYPEFKAAIKRGRLDADIRLAKRGYEIAYGYSQEVEKLITVSLGSGMGSEVQRHTVTEIIPPNAMMLKAILSAKHSDTWGSEKQTAHTITNNTQIINHDSAMVVLEASAMDNAALTAAIEAAEAIQIEQKEEYD